MDGAHNEVLHWALARICLVLHYEPKEGDLRVRADKIKHKMTRGHLNVSEV